jgi:membrane protein DedA with SNARE-associated domain
MPVLLAADVASTWWQYVLLFLAVAASFAGVPAIGATALGAASVAASQGRLDLALTVIVSTAAGEVGGLVGYFIGNRWGRILMERPGKHQAGRQRMVEEGERAYARYGPLAVFFTPSIVSGTARMRRRQFIVWNLVDAFAFSLSVAASAYGVGKLVTGNLSGINVASLVLGIGVGALLVLLTVRHHRRTRKAMNRGAPDVG